MKKQLILLFFIALFNINTGLAQDSIWVKPLHKFLQENADSTIIFQHDWSMLHSPEYTILSKKKDTITAYTYRLFPRVDQRISLPRAILSKLNHRNTLAIFQVPIDVNMYFNPKYLSKDTLNQFWSSISKLEPWNIKYDSPEWPIDKEGNKIQIYDGGGSTIFLITQDNIKKISYYAPHSYEELIPGNKGRQNMIKIQELFHQHFGPPSKF